MKRTTYIALLAAALTACTKENTTDSSDRIGLNATVGELIVTSKATADPFTGGVPSRDNILNAQVWFSYDPEAFTHNPVEPEYLPCHTAMEFDGPDLKFAEYKASADGSEVYPIKYPIPGTAIEESESVYCIGLHPSDGWTSEDGFKTVSHEIDGKSDLMFADVIEGTWDRKFPAQSYNHLLTWIKISVCATTVDAAQHWGKIKSMSISSAATANIDFAVNGSSITYAGNEDIPVDLISRTGETDGIGLEITSRDAGSIFCSPEAKYSITVNTEYGGAKTVNIPKLTDENGNEIKDIGQIRGKLFVISLYFNPFDIIEGTCTLNYWNDQSEDLYLK